MKHYEPKEASMRLFRLPLCLVLALSLILHVSFERQARAQASFSGYTSGRSTFGERVLIGKRQARGLLRTFRPEAPATSTVRHPAILMIPGSGQTGPEYFIPKALANTDTDIEWFAPLAETLHASGAVTLQLGKPGIDFQSDGKVPLYDPTVWKNLTWKDYLDHLSDAVTWLKGRPEVDSNRIYLLGHSEGTDAVAHWVEQNPGQIAGLILLGVNTDNIVATYRWQLIDREWDWFLGRDVDTNHDHQITSQEIALWPDSFWYYQIPEASTLSRAEAIGKLEHWRLWSLAQIHEQPFFQGYSKDSGSLSKLLGFSGRIVALTGEWDVATPATMALKLQAYCQALKRSNCEVEILPTLGHAFSEPRAPRAHPLLDATFGLPSPQLLEKLTRLGGTL